MTKEDKNKNKMSISKASKRIKQDKKLLKRKVIKNYKTMEKNQIRNKKNNKITSLKIRMMIESRNNR